MTRDRLCRVTLAKPRPTPTTRLGAFVGELLPNGLEVTDLRVKFEVKRSTSSAPNTALITIYNLAPASRAQVIERPQVVMLEAGYRSTGLRRLLAGGVTALAALREVASAMGLSVPRSVELRPELGRQFVQGLSLFGSASDAMSRLLAPFGLGWSIQDGELRILDERGVGPGEALSIDQDAGMIGSPEVNPPSKPKGKPTVSVKCLLLPEAKPGGQVQLVSRTVTGLHKIKEAGHAGDTHGPEWTTSLEVTAL
jgi:hypothetical protein